MEIFMPCKTTRPGRQADGQRGGQKGSRVGGPATGRASGQAAWHRWKGYIGVPRQGFGRNTISPDPRR